MTSRYVIGIDLGTTNSVMAYVPLDADKPQIQLLDIPQLTDLSTVESFASLASFTYLAPDSPPGVADGGGLDLPWATERNFAVGHWARGQAAEAPERTVAAAKSWLCHGRVDRQAAILPWNAPSDVPKISPVTAAQRYLEHLVSAWHAAFPDAPVGQQQVVLTVPASFDAVARELTREAALAAGLPADLVLLEEPQSAVYWWLAAQGDDWRKQLAVSDRLLVCDVGGGTTDLTLIGVAEQAGDLVLQRLAVGHHLLMGGDNMDLALAHRMAGRFADEQGVSLDPWQSVGLWHSCRAAKEVLLAPDAPETYTLSVLGRGSRLIGGTVSLEIDSASTADFLVDGFLPHCAITDPPQVQRASGFQEIGLPFESDTAITRHVANFLARQADSGQEPAPPSHVLFNGGVFNAPALRRRMLDVLGEWSGVGQRVQPLEGVRDLDHAVARGAAYYGWTKKQGGIRIRGGVARSYYVGIETAGLAIPGAARPLRALCVVPFGMEEGTERDVPSAEIGLIHGQPVKFRFFSSSDRHQDQPGELLDRWSDSELVETAPLEASLEADSAIDTAWVPVRFQSRITELGMFELWCVSTQGDGQWKLEFSVRDRQPACDDGSDGHPGAEV